MPSDADGRGYDFAPTREPDRRLAPPGGPGGMGTTCVHFSAIGPFPNCDLCLTEKLFIIKNSMNPRTINKKQDISNKCIHKKLYYYKKLDNSDDFSDII